MATTAQHGGALRAPTSFQTERARGLGLSAYELVMAVMVGAMAGIWGATQAYASFFNYDDDLGARWDLFTPGEAWMGAAFFAAMAAIGAFQKKDVGITVAAVLLGLACVFLATTPVYPPMEFVRWIKVYPEPNAVARGWMGFALVGLPAAGGVLVALKGGAVKQVSTAHGSARWGATAPYRLTKRESQAIERAREEKRPVKVPALVFGREENEQKTPLLYRGDGHAIVTAGTRAGKGTGFVIPNLLLGEGSYLINDTKAENFFITYRKRAALGHQLFVLDPYGVTIDMPGKLGQVSKPYLATSNPLDLIRIGDPRALSTARMIARAIVEKEDGPNAHFSDEARGALAGVILYVCFLYEHEPEKRTLPQVRKMVARPVEQFNKMLAEMQGCPYEAIQIASSEILQKEEKERSGAISTIHRFTRWIDDPAMQQVLGHSERMFDVQTIKSDSVTTYLVIPPDLLEENAPWFRIMMSCASAAMVNPKVPKPRVPVTLMVDEAAQIGSMPEVEKAMTLLTGYGLRVCLILQNQQQLEKLYPKSHKTIWGQAELKLMFGIGDDGTAEVVSKTAGEATVYSESGSSGSSRGGGKGGGSRNAGESTSEKARKLLTLDEALRVSKDHLVVFVTGEDPLFVAKAKYFEHPLMKADAEPNPYYNGVAA